jgi:hypothetical protein
VAGFARAALGVAVGCTALVGVGAGTAHAAPYACTGQAPQQALSTETPEAGDTVTDVLTCFDPNEQVTGLFFSTPQRIFAVTTDGTGSATATFQVPAGACGDHTVVARGEDGDRAATPITVAGCRHRNHGGGHGNCHDWRDPGFWIKNCDTPNGGWETGFDAAYSAPLPVQHSSNTTMAGVVGLGLLTPVLLGGGVLIARRRSR